MRRCAISTGARVLAEPHRDRVARNRVHEKEADDRDRDQHEHEPDERSTRKRSIARLRRAARRARTSPPARRGRAAPTALHSLRSRCSSVGEARRASSCPNSTSKRAGFVSRNVISRCAVAQPPVKRALHGAFVAGRGIARATGAQRADRFRGEPPGQRRFVDSLAGRRVDETRGRAADHHAIGADRRAREPAVEQVAFFAHACTGCPEKSRRSTVARNASSSARSAAPGTFAWMPRPIER